MLHRTLSGLVYLVKYNLRFNITLLYCFPNIFVPPIFPCYGLVELTHIYLFYFGSYMFKMFPWAWPNFVLFLGETAKQSFQIWPNYDLTGAQMLFGLCQYAHHISSLLLVICSFVCILPLLVLQITQGCWRYPAHLPPPILSTTINLLGGLGWEWVTGPKRLAPRLCLRMD